ncbi:MAG TPA: choice-of-anchor V domain-containing protein [Saprospiraceae bacterium]|nr:choice-of-anchor V domain-containing protein [Saprospiraceae bacterium]
MQKLQRSRLLPITGLLLGTLVWLANNGNPPTGKTGSPFNGNCNECHNGSNYTGTVEVSGFPATADPGATYDINLKITASSGNPVKAGFQLVVVDGSNANCGDLINITGNGTGTEMLQSREYMEQRNGKNFAGGTVSWDFQWKAPTSMNGNTIKAYFIGNMCNGTGGSGGDNPVWDNITFSFAGSPPLTAEITSSTNPTCNGSSNGNATVEATGGSTPYTYAWTGGQTTQTASNLAAGTYTVTVTGANGSGTATASITLTQPPVLNLSVSVAGTVTCNTTATATASATGGTPGYTFNWSNGQSGDVVIFDEIGTYSVTTTDNNGCTKATTVNITGNVTPPMAFADAPSAINCFSPQVQLSGAGSSTGSAFSYQWTTTDGNIVSGATSLNPTVNKCGTYLLTVTNTTNGCTATASASPECLVSPPDASASGGTITCSNPTIRLTGNSNTPGVNYTWSGPGISPSNQFEQNPEVNAPGIYTLTVTNPENGCTKTAVATVGFDITPPTANGSVSGTLTCLVTSVSLNLTTNVPNATFEWTGPNGFSSNIPNPGVSVGGNYFGVVTNPANGCEGFDTVTVVSNTTPPGVSAFVSGQITCLVDSVTLSGSSPAAPNVTYSWTGNNFQANSQNAVTYNPGAYTLVVTGTANGCTSSAVVNVVENTTIPTDSIVPPANLNCNNASVQLNATPSSQGPNFKYLWTAKEGGHIVSGDTTLTPVVDSVGKYFLRITNIDNGCTSLDSVKVKLSPPVTASVSSIQQVSCFNGGNGTATVAGAGGNGVFTYAWNTGDSTATAANLVAGTYFVSVTDGESCFTTLSVSITQPDQLLANASATGETALGANDGTATANPSGGTAAYTYLWSTGATTQTITNLGPGPITVSVTDANGCVSVETVTVNAFGCNLSGSISATPVSCQGSNDGLAAVSLTGATNPVTYNWSNGATTQSVNNLAPGTYTASVVDGGGCPAVFSVNITEPPALSVNATATGVTAIGATDGTATANPTGGTAGYQYQWSTGSSAASISGLAPGTYTVSVTDANGCTAQQSVNVAAFNCALNASISAVNTSCFGSANGQATITLSNGTQPYTYNWSNGASTQSINNLAAGTYTVSASDGAGCSITQTVNIGQPDELVATVVSIQNVLCPDDTDGQVEITVTGGTSPYSYNWQGGNPGSLGVGNYSVSVTDANACIDEVSFSIVATDNVPPTMTCPADIQICGPDFISYGTPSVTDNCGVAIPPVLISGPASGSLFDEGNSVIVYQATDVVGNTATCSFNITVFPTSDILIDQITNDMNGQQVGAISVTAVGVGPFTYAWNKNGVPFASTEDLSGLGAGSYTLVITDGNGCTSALAPVIITNTVGTSDLAETGTLKLWPNPTSTSIQLEIIDLDVLSVQLVDLRGSLIQEISLKTLAQPIDVQSIPAGMYCLVVNTADGQVLSLKFVKE